jgi:hypothetical protein
MTALEFIGIARAKAAHAKLREASELLLRPCPATLADSCSLLSEVTDILEELMAANAREKSGELSPEFAKSLLPIRQAAQELQVQIEHGSRFCLGWLQMRMGVGYTQGGAPIMLESRVESGKGRSFEA